MIITCENATIKMNDKMVNSKTRSEVEFPMNDCRTSPLNSFKLRVEMHNCLLTCKKKTDKHE